MAEHHRLSTAPVLVIDLRTVFHRNRTHCLPPFFSVVVVAPVDRRVVVQLQ